MPVTINDSVLIEATEEEVEAFAETIALHVYAGTDEVSLGFLKSRVRTLAKEGAINLDR